MMRTLTFCGEVLALAFLWGCVWFTWYAVSL